MLTNAKGVYSNSLAEFALMACKYFAMNMPRLLKAQREGRWAPFEVEELRGKTLGVVGYGDIGQACARLAKAYQMRVVGLRRRTAMTDDEAALVVSPPQAMPTGMAEIGVPDQPSFLCGSEANEFQLPVHVFLFLLSHLTTLFVMAPKLCSKHLPLPHSICRTGCTHPMSLGP